MLMQKTALITSGIVFGLLALSHAIRWLSPFEISINGQTLPFIISLSSGIILALLSIWMLLAARKTKFPKNENKEEN
jgi:lysylphosphatidylglycerol synthetase-like protein (DUF2156 family)